MKKILVIDDDETFRLLFAKWIESEGFYPITAKDGLEGIRLAQSHHPDLIFCNVNMLIIDGIEVLKQVRKDENISHTPVFLLTSETRLSSRLIKQFGANGFFSKGAEIQELKQIIALINV